ncbi:MAG: phenylacetate--CoA ligase family protein, partial [Verrucomicrobia bacterium]|nr:phenylacetate--CoA ligase family protein [Verrucomicrobiota bacterium]
MSLEDKLYPLLAVYERLPQGVKTTMGLAYRCLPMGWRMGGRFAEFQKLARDVESWSLDQIREYQWQQIRKVLLHADNFCPGYRDRFARAGFNPSLARSVEDLEKCPFLEKQDLLEHRDSFCSTEVASKDRLYITTGGSTGVPVGFYLHRGVSRPKEQAFLDAQWGRAGYVPGMRMAVVRGHVTSSQAAGQISSYDATRGWLMLSSYHLTEDRLPEYLTALEQFRPELLHAYPSAALQLAEFIERSGRSWTLPLRGLLAGSERLNIPQKRILERVFKCRVFRWYG